MGAIKKASAMKYFRNPLWNHYRPRYCVSLLSSRWNQVVPQRSNHRGKSLNFVPFLSVEPTLRPISTSRLKSLRTLHR